MGTRLAVGDPGFGVPDQLCDPIRLRTVGHLPVGHIVLLGGCDIRLVVYMLAHVRHAVRIFDGVEEGDGCEALPCHELTGLPVSAAPARLHVAQTRVEVGAHLPRPRRQREDAFLARPAGRPRDRAGRGRTM